MNTEDCFSNLADAVTTMTSY